MKTGDVELTTKRLTPGGIPDLGATTFKGYVEVYGHHGLAGGWFFVGWVSKRADLTEIFETAAAEFTGDTISGPGACLTFFRQDVGHEGIGFVIFLPADSNAAGGFRHLRLQVDGAACTIGPIAQAHHLPEVKLAPQLNFIVAQSEPGLQRAEMERLLGAGTDAAGNGYVEYYGYHPSAGGWLVSGWISHPWAEGEQPERVVISFDNGDVQGVAVAVLYTRPELNPGALGVIFFVQAPLGALGALHAISLRAGARRVVLAPVKSVPQLREAELTARVRANLVQARPGLFRDRLANLLARRPYAGDDTFDALSPGIFLHIDEAIRCGSAGVVLMGWLLAKPGDIHELRLCCDAQSWVIQPQDFVKIDRPDVLVEFARHGFDDPACGFIAFVPAAVDPHGRLYIEAETQRWEVSYRNMTRPSSTGMSAIKRLLGAVDVRFEELRHAFDRVLGPAVEALNQERLATPVGYQLVAYGNAPATPKYSVIVPLYGRLDFVEYQMALFSARPEFAGVEIIYVLDDPPKRREAQNLFASVYQRFLIPFRAVLLERNVGFAPANNVGLRHAHGKFVVYLNSDVFPGTPDWLELLSAQLDADPGLGVVGPLLLFEDGSVQHRGMYFERLPEYADWFFCQHLDKGLRYTGGTNLQQHISITGACMVLRRELANQLGGFDEMYAIGDFEDSDLCLKVQALGLTCAVDAKVRLYHLERKSQISGGHMWRANLTAYNAWQHERRWGGTIAELQRRKDIIDHG
jgi:GT2 family glycosyltransferase